MQLIRLTWTVARVVAGITRVVAMEKGAVATETGAVAKVTGAATVVEAKTAWVVQDEVAKVVTVAKVTVMDATL